MNILLLMLTWESTCFVNTEVFHSKVSLFLIIYYTIFNLKYFKMPGFTLSIQMFSIKGYFNCIINYWRFCKLSNMSQKWYRWMFTLIYIFICHNVRLEYWQYQSPTSRYIHDAKYLIYLVISTIWRKLKMSILQYNFL